MATEKSISKTAQPLERLSYRPQEFAKATGLGLTKTWELISNGSLPSRRIGRCTLIPADAARRFIMGEEAA